MEALPSQPSRLISKTFPRQTKRRYYVSMRKYCVTLPGTTEIRQGCRRKSYSGNLGLSLNSKSGVNSVRTVRSMANVTLTLRNIIHPLDKIFAGIPVGSLNPSTLL